MMVQVALLAGMARALRMLGGNAASAAAANPVPAAACRKLRRETMVLSERAWGQAEGSGRAADHRIGPLVWLVAGLPRLARLGARRQRCGGRQAGAAVAAASSEQCRRDQHRGQGGGQSAGKHGVTWLVMVAAAASRCQASVGRRGDVPMTGRFDACRGLSLGHCGGLVCRAWRARQRARRLGGWPRRRWSPGRWRLLRSGFWWFEPADASGRCLAFEGGWTNPTLGRWQPAGYVIGGTPTAALRALPISGLRLWHGVRRCARTRCRGRAQRLFSPAGLLAWTGADSRLRAEGDGQRRAAPAWQRRRARVVSDQVEDHAQGDRAAQGFHCGKGEKVLQYECLFFLRHHGLSPGHWTSSAAPSAVAIRCWRCQGRRCETSRPHPGAGRKLAKTRSAKTRIPTTV
ncbi:exported hypothetical protein [Cupriavidus taiwanensis]|uniref:Uncharacterized protein n=1 Tax=Cupriavidus taiwanensis TaxID=164546 RepID=A0A975WXV4_9BURK|nr:exported hypothetical protein [Cupriavidus taiwanensis]